MSESPSDSAVSGHSARDFYTPGSIEERVNLQLGVLTQGVVDCMMLATGAFPDLTEGPAAQVHPMVHGAAKSGSSWQAARSAELRDAARLTEASARLLAGFAKVRGQFSQDFTIRHSDRRGANAKKRMKGTTVTHRFSVPAQDALGDGALPDATAADLTRGLSKIAEDLARTGVPAAVEPRHAGPFADGGSAGRAAPARARRADRRIAAPPLPRRRGSNVRAANAFKWVAPRLCRDGRCKDCARRRVCPAARAAASPATPTA